MLFQTAAQLLLAGSTTLYAVTDARKLAPNTTTRRLNKAALLKNAIKVDRNLTPRRKLDDEDVVTGAHSLQFNACVSMTMEANENDEVMFSDDLVDYTKNGQIVSEASYIVFNLCETEYCSYYDMDNLYMVDLATFMQSTIGYEPQRINKYCEACQEAQNWCLYGQYEDDAVEEEAEEEEEEEEEGGEEEEEEGGEEEEGEENEDGEDRRLRKLAQNNFEVVDCDTCASMECFVDEDENGNRRLDEEEIDMEGIAQWVEGIAECQQTDAVLGNYNLYAGFICNGDGSGVEIGLFLDEDCSVYTSVQSYGNVVGDDDVNYYQMSQDVVTYPFVNDLSCAELPEYITPEEYEENQQNGNDDEEEDDEDQNNEANEYCQNLFGDNVRSLNDCDANGVDDEDENDDDGNDDGNAYDWYEFILSQQDAENPTKVCYLIQSMEGEYTVVYNDGNDSSGSFYDYSSNTSKNKAKGQGANVALIVIGLLAAAIALVCIVQNCFSTSKSDSRREHLINKGNKGAMA